MLDEKQIEKMSEDIASMLCEAYRPDCDEYQPHTCSKCYVNSTPIGCFAEMLYNAGYRKQSEGEWVMIPVNGVVRWRCGNIDCARIIPFGTVPNELNYCPNCGARMKGGT